MMKAILLYLVFITLTLLSAATNIAYDRNNVEIEQILSKVVFDIEDISVRPVLNQSKGLYQIKDFDDVSMATSLSVTLNAINNDDPSKANKYTLISALQKQKIHIVVSKASQYRTIYDLNNRNVNVGVEGNAMDLFSMSLSSVFKIMFNKQYNKPQSAITNMIQGGGIDAVMFSEKLPFEFLSKYKEHIRLISIPSMKGFKQVIINKKTYNQDNDVMSIESDLVLIGSNEYISNNQISVNKIIDNIFNNKQIDKLDICNRAYVLQTYQYQKSKCSHFNKMKNIGKLDKPKKQLLNLVKKINSIEDIEVYSYALLKKKTFGGLSKQTELKKLEEIIKYYKEEGGSQKIIIKSYSSSSDAYKGGQKIFKLLKKRGVKRGNMIIKSFNQTKCNKKADMECQYINNKVIFEFL